MRTCLGSSHCTATRAKGSATVRVGVIGAGALGSAIGGTLAEAGNDVLLVNRNRTHVDAINRHGLTMHAQDKDRIVPVRAAVPAEAGEPVDLVIVLVKSFHTAEAVTAAIGLIGPNTTVLSLQNGLGHEDILGNLIGRDKVIAGKTYVGGVMLGPGQVIAAVAGKETIIGELDGRVTPRIERIAATFEAAGMPLVVSRNILGAMWDKLLVNVATGALSGITRLAYGGLYAVPELEVAATAAVAEAIAVAKASGIALETVDPHEAWVKAASGLPAEFKASMLQSLEKGSVTEVDFINGAVVRAGAKTGVPTPVNATLVACVKGIERAACTAGRR
nr:ketopantoate reductase family protein [Bradyrhizobium manausense]